MATMPPPSLNGRPRKQLSDQLDRLDEVINGLEEFLPQAMADAARDGIRQAFRDVVAEVVTDPTVLERLRTALVSDMVPLTVVPKPSAFARLKAFLRGVASKATAAVSFTRHRVAETVAERCASAKSRVVRWTLLSLPVKSIVGVSLAIGFVVALVSLATPHHIAAAISGFGATFTAASIQVGNWLRSRKAVLGRA
ncbi:hypothetical protein BH11PLA2_BH11PLA2_23660 [soil metagenome]